MIRLVRALAAVMLVAAQLALPPAGANAVYGGLRLPYPPGSAYVVTQGPGATQSCATGGGSHCHGNDIWAYDFGLRSGDRIVAAHSGTVIRFVQGSGSGSCDPAFRNDANYLIVDHGDGYSSIYWHIKYGSASVAPGQFVAQGHPLAEAGATGIVCGSPGDHLHFAVQPTPADGQSALPSIEARFDEAGAPRAGTAPVSANRPRFSAEYVGGSEWIVMGAGERRQMTGLWRNTGWAAWHLDVPGEAALLGTWGPEPGQDRISPLLRGPRVAPSTTTVVPGQVAAFPFEIVAPPTPGIYRLYLRPVIEGVQWLEDYGVFWLVDRR